MLRNRLEQLGFSVKETACYLALLELGTSTITQIARRAELNRTTLYDIIPTLVQRGLISTVGGTKKETYAAEPPEKLIVTLEQQSISIKEQVHVAKALIPELKMLQSGSNRPRLQLYEGHKGIVSLYEQTLLATEDIRSFTSTDSLEAFDREYLYRYYKRRAEKKIFIKAIINYSPSAMSYQKQDQELYRELRIAPKEKMNIKPDVYIYDDKVIFFSLKEGYGILVESADISQSLMSLYDLAWIEAGRLNR